MLQMQCGKLVQVLRPGVFHYLEGTILEITDDDKLVVSVETDVHDVDLVLSPNEVRVL